MSDEERCKDADDPWAEFERKWGKYRSPERLAALRARYEQWKRDGRPPLRGPDDPEGIREITYAILEAADRIRAISPPPA